jgi:hypothetical protein
MFAVIYRYNCRQLPEVTIFCTIFSKFARNFAIFCKTQLAVQLAVRLAVQLAVERAVQLAAPARGRLVSRRSLWVSAAAPQLSSCTRLIFGSFQPRRAQKGETCVHSEGVFLPLALQQQLCTGSMSSSSKFHLPFFMSFGFSIGICFVVAC